MANSGENMLLELTEEEYNVAFMLLNEEITTVEDLIREHHQINSNSSELDKADVAGIKRQLSIMKSISNKLKICK